VPWAGSDPTDRILLHLAEIGAGRCTITDDVIVAEPDPDMRQVLLGLLVLHEDLTYASRQRTAAETMLRGIAEERERLLQDRTRAIEARDQFLAVAAHELRTPLATLALLVDHLMTTALPASATPPEAASTHSQQLALLQRQVERLTALVTQMLDVSRITGGGLELVPAPIDLRDVVRDVVDRFALEIQHRHVSVNVDAPDPVPGAWDAGRVDQVVTNLLSNALKYGAGRPIEVSVRGEAARALLVVRDYGVGIPEDEQGKVFRPFARATTARYHPGLGLGLWIAQQIVHASAGRISVNSRIEEGSTFIVELPR
jgi:signal transduction histidine kinase